MKEDIKDSSIDEGAIKPSYKTYIFILLFLLYFFDIADRFMVSSLFPYIKQDWGLSDTELGLLVSTIYWAIVIFVFPISILVDRWSRKKSIAIMATIWSLVAMASAFTQNFKQLFTTRTILGIGEAAYVPGGLALISGLYPMKNRAKMLGLWMMAIPLGTAAGIALGGVIAANWGWRHAFGIMAAPGLVVAILFFFIKDYKTVKLEKTVSEDGMKKEKSKMKIKDIAKEFFNTPTLLFAYLGLTFSIFTTTSIISWLPTYFNRTYNIPVDQAGLKASLIMVLAVIGTPLGGFLTDLWIKKKINGRLMFPAISTLVSAILLMAGLAFFKDNSQYIVLLAMGLTVAAFGPAVMATMQEVVHPGLRAMSYAIAAVISNLLGASLGPIVIGAISDASNIQTAFLILPVSLVIAAGLFFAGSFFYTKDFNKVEKIQLEIER
jgi:MFS family permease